MAFIFWQEVRDGLPISFSISNAGTPDIELPPEDPAIDEFEAFRLAFATWETVPGVPVQFALSETSTNQLGFDGENVIFFADLGDVGYGGVTMITFDNTTGRILDVDIHMNDYDILWHTSMNDTDGEPLPCPCEGTDPDAVFTNDVQGLAAHEIGHALGLDHSAIGIRESATTPTMYPRGIFSVPGDGDRPPNSRYRSLELDDVIGLQNIYRPAGWEGVTGQISGIVHDRVDQPLFGAHIVARNLTTGVEVGTMSGVVEGAFVAEAYELLGLPSAQYQVRVEPIDGSAPGLVSGSNFGGIAQALVPAKFPSEVDLPLMYHRLVFEGSLATPVTLTEGDVETVVFRPMAFTSKLPKFIQIPLAFELEGVLNAEVTGPLQAASLVYTVDNGASNFQLLPLSGGTFTVPIPELPAGSLLEYKVEVQTLAGEAFQTLPVKLQVGLSCEPLVLVSKHGSGKLAAVDTGTLFEISEARTSSLSEFGAFPLGQAFHVARHGFYVANFGTDTVGFLPLFEGSLPPTEVRTFDDDGDGLLNELEPIFGTDPGNPDSDGDFSLDGNEISELSFTHPDAGSSFFDVVGGTVASDGTTALGSPFVNIAVFDIDQGAFATAAMRLTPSGRFHLRLPTGATYSVSYFDDATGSFLTDSTSFNGASGDVVSVGVTQVDLPGPDPIPVDTGTDPLDPFDGAVGVFLPLLSEIALESGADPFGIALGPGDQRYLFVTGQGTNKVYKIDTQTNELVGETTVGTEPQGVVVTPDGQKVYVANTGSSSLSVLDADSLATLTTIALSGGPRYVSVTADGSTAVVTMSGDDGVAFVDVGSDAVVASGSSGLSGTGSELYFMAPRSPDGHVVLAGKFQVNSNQLALIDVPGQSVTTIDLGTSVNTSAGLAFHPDGERGYVVNYFVPELVAFDVATGNVLGRVTFDSVDIRDLSILEEPGGTCSNLSGSSTTVLVANFMNGNDAAFNSRVYLFNPSQSAGEVSVRVFTLPLTGSLAQELTVTPLNLGTLEARSALNIKLADDILAPLGIILPYTDHEGDLTLEFTIEADNVRGAAQVFSSSVAFGTYPLQEIPPTSSGTPTVLVANFLNGNDAAFNSRVYLFNPSASAGEVTVRVFTLPLDTGTAQELTVTPLSLGTLGARSALNIKLAEDILISLGITTPYITDGGNLTVEFTIQAANVRGAAQVVSPSVTFGVYPLQEIPSTSSGTPTVLVANFMNGNSDAFNSRVYLWNPSTSSGNVTVRVFTLPLGGGTAQELTGTALNLGTLGAKSALNIKLAEDILTPLGIITPYITDGGNLTLEFTIQAADVGGTAQVFSDTLAFGTYPLQEIPSTSTGSATVLVANFTNGNNAFLNSRLYLWNPSQSAGSVTVRAYTLPSSGPSILLGTAELGVLDARSSLNIKIAEDVLSALGIPLPYTDNGGNLTIEVTVGAENVRGAAQVFSSDLAYGTYPMQVIQ
ncbi:MAG: hypothetical protein E2P05_09345 [Acidobacteria bacterium]|nr:MAG: hypothetical protein E2P05_09345 [Acidobacteriota bacterium]